MMVTRLKRSSSKGTSFAYVCYIPINGVHIVSLHGQCFSSLGSQDGIMAVANIAWSMIIEILCVSSIFAPMYGYTFTTFLVSCIWCPGIKVRLQINIANRVD